MRAVENTIITMAKDGKKVRVVEGIRKALKKIVQTMVKDQAKYFFLSSHIWR